MRPKSRSCRNLCGKRVTGVCAPYAPRCGTERRPEVGRLMFRLQLSPATTIEAPGLRYALPYRSDPCGADFLLLARSSSGLPERAVSSASLGDARARRAGACRLSTRCTQHAGRASISSERLTPRWTAPKSAFGLLRLFAAVRHLACAAASPSRASRAAQAWRACGISTTGLGKPPTTAEAGSGAAGGAPGSLSAHATHSNLYPIQSIPKHESAQSSPYS